MAFFQILPCRYDALEATIDGFERTGVPLVAYNSCGLSAEGNIDGLGPAGYSDDIGSYYFIPKIVEIFGVSLDTAIQLLYSGSLFLAFIAGAIGSWLYCETKSGKAISLIVLAFLSLIIAGIGDIYTYSASIPLALIPLWLYLQKQGGPNHIVLYFFLAGLVIAFGHLIRVQSGMPTLVFLCVSLLFFSSQYSKKIKAFSVIVFIAAASLVVLGFDIVLQQRIDFLTDIGSTVELSDRRYQWHVIYKSLGYLSNTFGYANWPGHEPSDVYASFKAHSVNPSVIHASAEYENILRLETFKFIREHPIFFMHTIFAKFGVLLMYILFFANIGLLLTIYYSRGIAFNLLFSIGIGLNMFSGLLTLPHYQYLMGLFVFCTLFNLYIIDYAIKMKTSRDPF